MAGIGRRAYAEMFGPTVGDRLRLADTELTIEVEADYTLRAGGYGEEVKFGGGDLVVQRRQMMAMVPGEYFIDEGEHTLNPGRRTTTLVVQNTADRPIQVGSHYHFAETNAALGFDRAAARGMRLNIASGMAVRFEPGQQRTVELVDYAGERQVYGFRGLTQGAL